jgi:hypothetical protein
MTRLRNVVCGVGLATLAFGGAPLAWAAGPGSYDWLQFNGDPRHSGNNTQETRISTANVATLRQGLHVTLPAVADGAPVVLSGVSTAGGVRDLVFVATTAGHILALDLHSGATVWSRQNAAGACGVNGGSTPCYTTSSPAIDPSRAYVYGYGLDGRVHKYAVGDGTEVTTGGWPELATNKPGDEKGSTPLAFATAKSGTSYLYAVNGGYIGDNGDYQGHVTAISLTDGSQHVFNAVCSDQSVHFVSAPGTPDCASVRSAVWARAAVVYDPDVDKIYFGTGNGDYAPSSHYWGDSVLALAPDGSAATGDPLDAYTPTTFAQLAATDSDLGSTAPALLPAPATSSVRHLALQGGKDALLRLLNLDNLSGQGGPGHTGGSIGAPFGVPQGGQTVTAPAVWVNPADGSTWTFVASGNGISALKVAVDSAGNPSLTTVWQGGNGGTSPIIANGVLFYASSGVVRALAPTTGAILWTGTIGGLHWQSPVVANGILLVTDQNGALTSFALPLALVPALPGGWAAALAVLLLVSSITATSARSPLRRAARRKLALAPAAR